MKTLSFLLAILSIVISSQAQQLPQLSQYYLNQYSINPAATGISDNFPLAFTYRKSYAGLKGSPSLQYLTADLEVYKDMGAGVKFFNYQTGPMRKSGMEATYSYHLELKDDMYLSFGLSGVLYQYFLNKSNLITEDQDDPAMLGAESKVILDASFGTYFYGRNFYAGFAMPQLVNRSIDPNNAVVQEKQVRHYYLHGGYSYEANEDMTLEPSLLLKFVEAGVFQADINIRAIYQDMFSLGVAYRTSDAVIVHLGIKYNDLLFAYAIDFTLSDIKAASFGSHEITLMYTLENFLK
jgi:type IX secretion system PorP/SprF family membrane protein